ncbi:MAG: hypothetical protein RBU21_09520 [FCB group bacterium]|jgi:hypothetical protein|nr:hypothetical protein [FCB group bacterium]
MKKKATPKGRQWVWVREKPSSAPPAVKAEVCAKAQALVDSELKPRHIEPPPEKSDFNYIVDITTKWRGRFFYFASKYASPGPNAISPYFDAPFTRLEYRHNGRFNLAYMRHTGQWWQLYEDLTIEEAMEAIREEELFQP